MGPARQTVGVGTFTGRIPLGIRPVPIFGAGWTARASGLRERWRRSAAAG